MTTTPAYTRNRTDPAAQQYAGQGGTVVRVEVSAEFAQSIRQASGGMNEFFVAADDAAGLSKLNSGITGIEDTATAFTKWKWNC